MSQNIHQLTVQMGNSQFNYINSFGQQLMISSSWSSMFQQFIPTFIWVPAYSGCFGTMQQSFQVTDKSKNQQLPKIIIAKNTQETRYQRGSRRRTWTFDEDQKLLAIIKNLDISQNKRMPYHKIAREFKGRTSKQIRERYLNHLNSSINKEPFRKEQDESILKYYQQNGPKWKKLSQIMRGRTPTSLKNRFNTKLKHTLTLLVNSSKLSSSGTTQVCKQKPYNILDSRVKSIGREYF